MSHTELDLIVAELMFPILVELAPMGSTIRYTAMADLIKPKNPNVTEISNITGRHIGKQLKMKLLFLMPYQPPYKITNALSTAL